MFVGWLLELLRIVLALFLSCIPFDISSCDSPRQYFLFLLFINEATWKEKEKKLCLEFNNACNQKSIEWSLRYFWNSEAGDFPMAFSNYLEAATRREVLSSRHKILVMKETQAQGQEQSAASERK